MKLLFIPRDELTGNPSPFSLDYDILDEETSTRRSNTYRIINQEDDDVLISFTSNNGIIFVEPQSRGRELNSQYTLKPGSFIDFRVSVSKDVINSKIREGVGLKTLRTNIVAVKRTSSSVYYALRVTPTTLRMALDQNVASFTAVLEEVSDSTRTPVPNAKDIMTIRSENTQEAIVKNITQLSNSITFEVENLVGESLNTTLTVAVSPSFLGKTGEILSISIPISSEKFVDLSSPSELVSISVSPDSVDTLTTTLDSMGPIGFGPANTVIYDWPGRLISMTVRNTDSSGVTSNQTIPMSNISTFLSGKGYDGSLVVENPGSPDQVFDLSTFDGKFDILIPLELTLSDSGTLDAPDLTTSVFQITSVIANVNGISVSNNIEVNVEGVATADSDSVTPPPSGGGGGGGGTGDSGDGGSRILI